MQKERCLLGRLDTKAFTLIELLVVVLIIGILAAVAVPQYQKAVEKSKAVQAITLVKSIYEAGEAYHLHTGTFPESFDELDLDIPWTGTTRAITDGRDYVDARSNNDWSLQLQKIIPGGNTNASIWITRLSGAYAGIGFVIRWTNTQMGPAGALWCTERKVGGISLAEEKRGKYCSKFFNAEAVSGGSWADYYKMP